MKTTIDNQQSTINNQQSTINKEPELLANCYTNSLKLAMENGIKTISFPAISTGVYGYPIEQAAIVALRTVIEFVKENDFFDEVVFMLYKQRDYDVYEQTLNKLSTF